MIKIRKGTFESNSSSMHTLIRVASDKGMAKLKKRYNHLEGFFQIDKETEWFTYPAWMVYARQEEILWTPFDKATYLISYFSDIDTQSTDQIPHYDEILKEVQKTYPNFKGWRKSCEECVYPFGYVEYPSSTILNDIDFKEILKTINDPLVVYFIVSDECETLGDLMFDLIYYKIIDSDDALIAPRWNGKD